MPLVSHNNFDLNIFFFYIIIFLLKLDWILILLIPYFDRRNRIKKNLLNRSAKKFNCKWIFFFFLLFLDLYFYWRKKNEKQFSHQILCITLIFLACLLSTHTPSSTNKITFRYIILILLIFPFVSRFPFLFLFNFLILLILAWFLFYFICNVCSCTTQRDE